MNFGFPKFIFNRVVLRQCLRNVGAIACVSDTTYSRLARYTPASVPAKSSRIYNCVEPASECATESPVSEWKNEPFLLCVAQHRRNKNIPLLIHAFDRLLRSKKIPRGMRLFVVGITGPETIRIRRLLENRGLGEQVQLLEGLSDRQLQWCYTNCKALVAPSSTEGFGLPVVEALLAGCKVVCSDIAAFQEAGREHCNFISLGKGEEERLAQAILSTLSRPTQVPVEFPHLSAPVLGEQYVLLYRRLLATASIARSTAFSSSLHPTSERQSL